MPLSYLWLMAVMLLMLYVKGKFDGSGFYCPFCGARSDEDHEPGCHGKDRW